MQKLADILGFKTVNTFGEPVGVNTSFDVWGTNYVSVGATADLQELLTEGQTCIPIDYTIKTLSNSIRARRSNLLILSNPAPAGQNITPGVNLNGFIASQLGGVKSNTKVLPVPDGYTRTRLGDVPTRYRHNAPDNTMLDDGDVMVDDGGGGDDGDAIMIGVENNKNDKKKKKKKKLVIGETKNSNTLEYRTEIDDLIRTVEQIKIELQRSEDSRKQLNNRTVSLESEIRDLNKIIEKPHNTQGPSDVYKFELIKKTLEYTHERVLSRERTTVRRHLKHILDMSRDVLKRNKIERSKIERRRVKIERRRVKTLTNPPVHKVSNQSQTPNQSDVSMAGM